MCFMYVTMRKHCLYYIPFSIDATAVPAEGPRLGRLVNHSTKPNAVSKIITVDNTPCLCLFALRRMDPGEQIVYNYGIRHLPFKDLVSYNSCISVYTFDGSIVGVVQNRNLFFAFSMARTSLTTAEISDECNLLHKQLCNTFIKIIGRFFASKLVILLSGPVP